MTRLETQLVKLKSAVEKIYEMTDMYSVTVGYGKEITVLLLPDKFAMLPGAAKVKAESRVSDCFHSHKRLTIQDVTFEALLEAEVEDTKDGE